MNHSSSNLVNNPQSNNGICERIHQTVGQVLRTLVHANPPNTPADAKRLIQHALAQAMHAA